jgi:TM2 domain-containing membrane protein YozV
MIAVTPLSTANWNDQQRALFNAQMSAWQKDEVVGVLLALFLGTFGAHHFYLRRPGLGILYALFSWTGIPTVIGFVECFFMPGRVRQFNLALATYFAAHLGEAQPAAPSSATIGSAAPAPVAGLMRTCAACGSAISAGANFCGRCGAKV